jgi:hypothetical protein
MLRECVIQLDGEHGGWVSAGMVVVPRVLLDQVDQDPSQAGCVTVGPGAPGGPLQAAVGARLRDQ